MSNRNTGGHAFPTSQIADSDGMTLRDYFAAKAMQSFVPTSKDDKQIAEWAYLLADAMLKARDA